MMISNISYKLSLFADYMDIAYTNENIFKIMSVFTGENILPGVISEVMQNGNTSKRLQFVSENGAIVVTILSSRIDVEITSLDKSGFTGEEIEQLSEKLQEIIVKIYKAFSDKIPDANRLAWFVTYMNFELSSEEKKNYRNMFVKQIPFYESNMTDEFMVRYSGTKDITINGILENVNAITTISYIVFNQGIDAEIDGYKIDFDINTWQGNRKNRFNTDNLSEFVNEARKVQSELEVDFINDYR